MYSTVVMGMSKEDLEHRLRAMKQRLGVKEDTAVPASGWKELVAEYKQYFKEKSAKRFRTIRWSNSGAQLAPCSARGWRRRPSPIAEWKKSPACSAQQSTWCKWSSENTGDNSGTGVCFTRDPSTGEKIFYGDYLTNAQGEDVVAGIRTPCALPSCKRLCEGLRAT